MEARQYRHNADNVLNLFENIIKSFGSSDSMDDMIFRTLSDVCRHFKSCCGFVYETDETETLNLKERFVAHEQSVILPKSFKWKKPFSLEEIGDMLKSPACFYHFDANSRCRDIMLVPILDNDKELIGLVGMLERGKDVLVDGQSLRIARMVFNLLGNGIKTRIIRKNYEAAITRMVNYDSPTRLPNRNEFFY